MATKAPAEPQARPEVGETLMVIHDFQARSSDELSLTKGDRVELVERDDEFGDGWFLGKHLANGNTGLFPEGHNPATQLPPVSETKQETTPAASTPEPQTAVTAAQLPQDTPVTLPLNASKPEPTAPPSVTSNPSIAAALGRLENSSQDSQVLNETLNVINEHITDLRSPASNGALRPMPPPTDSGSEYSAPLDHRMSYIHGEETDEEDEASHSRAEVEAWTPDDVAEFLFTSGVERRHCEVFRDQEISGEVLLGMDQSSLFINAFDLGSVGRRLKTWHRIKALQDEVSGAGPGTRRTTQTYGSEAGSEDASRTRGRTSTLTNSISNQPGAVHTRRLSATHNSRTSPSIVSPSQDSPTRPGHTKRPSAASIREINHSRRHSSTDYGATAPKLGINGTFPGADSAAHKKQPSFDRNWSLGNAFSQSPRPLSSTNLRGLTGGSDTELQDSAVDLDRGYFSGNEADSGGRNVLRKRDSVSHSRRTSYIEEQRTRSATAMARHSRFGSIDSYRDGAPPTAAQKYFGLPTGSHRRTASTNTTESIRPTPPAKDDPPAVTKLGESDRPAQPAKDSSWLSSLSGKKSGGGIRALSDNLGFDRSKTGTPSEPSTKDQALVSPARTGSNTPSGEPSFEIDGADAKSPVAAAATAAARNKGRKGKKETSAYTRGLQKISPKEAMKGADYSGWMRKKNSALMTTWKPRFFVLKGRRLAYYYSEDDDAEKGLIDISFHRVLPADNEKLTGLHATITGAAGGGPVSHFLPSGAGADSSGIEKGDDSMFIFKLVPPRAGLSRAVHFTKPTVHYFAVPNLKEGRLWMAALMKATIDRDDTAPITSTYQQKTISLAKARQQRQRPPALMNLDEATEDDQQQGRGEPNALGVFSEADSGVAGIDRGVASPQKA